MPQTYNVEYDGFIGNERATHGTIMVTADNASAAQSLAAGILAQRYDNFKITNVWRA